MSPTARPCVFLDRDGTVIVERHYLHDPERVELLPDAMTGLRRLAAQDYALVLITNQSGVGRGIFTASAVDAVHARLRDLLAEGGVGLDGIFYCPHRPEDECACRKPRPGLVHQAVQALDLDLRRSVMIGDKPCDMAVGGVCGLRTVLVTSGYGDAGSNQPDAIVANLAEAAAWIAVRP